MFKLMRQKRLISLAFALGVIGFSTYGIFHTAHAYNDITQAQNSDNTLALDSPYFTDKPVSGGSACNPLGCAVCGGCVDQQYQQNIEVLPNFTANIQEYY